MVSFGELMGGAFSGISMTTILMLVVLAVLIFLVAHMWKKTGGVKAFVIVEPGGYRIDRIKKEKDGDTYTYKLAKMKTMVQPPLSSDIRRSQGVLSKKIVLMSEGVDGVVRYVRHEQDQLIENEKGEPVHQPIVEPVDRNYKEWYTNTVRESHIIYPDKVKWWQHPAMAYFGITIMFLTAAVLAHFSF